MTGKGAVCSAWERCFEARLRTLFGRFGAVVGAHPWPFIVIPLLIGAALTAGLCNYAEVNDIRYQFTPLGSTSRREHAVAQDFLGDDGTFRPLTVLVVARNDSASLLADDYLAQVQQLARSLYQLTVADDDGRPFGFELNCSSYCGVNNALNAFLVAYRHIRGSNNPNVRLTYPIVDVFGEVLYVGNALHGVRMDAASRVLSVNVVLLQLFTVADDERVVERWERAILQRAHAAHPMLRAHANSVGVGSREVRRTGMSIVPYLAISFSAVLAFTTLSSLRAQPSRSKPWEALVGVLCPLFGSAAAFGACLWLGLRYQTIVNVSVFLVLAIGVDDVFIVLHAWHKSDAALPVPRRLAVTLAESGPSITITSLTNMLSFAVGALSDTPGIRTFCTYSAAAVVVSYFLQLTVFSATVALGGRREAAGRHPLLCCIPAAPNTVTPTPTVHFPLSRTKSVAPPVLPVKAELDWQHRFYCAYAKAVASWTARLLTTALMLTYWAVAVWGIRTMKVEISLEALLPGDSYLLDYQALHNEYVLPEAQQLSVFVNSPGDLRDGDNLRRVMHLVAEFETASHSYGAASTSFWLRHYLEFVSFLLSPDAPFNYEYLPDFLESAAGAQWRSQLRLSPRADADCAADRAACVRAFMFTTSYTNVTHFSRRIAVLHEWRRICARHAALNATVFDEYNFFADQVTSIRATTLNTVLVALGCMSVVCALFIPHALSIVCAVASVLSISAGVFGLLSLWSVDLGPLSMAAILMAIGFSVDFTSHMSYHYYKAHASSAEERLVIALAAIAWPMLQAGLSSCICVLTLTLHQSYTIMVFVKTVLLVVSLGLTHGLVVLPVLLTALPYSTRRSVVSLHSEQSSEIASTVSSGQHASPRVNFWRKTFSPNIVHPAVS